MKQKATAKLIKGPIGKTLIELTVPMTFGLLGMVMFNLVDTFFVGKLGTVELAALSFTFPVVLVITSLALGIGFGASVVISRAIGEGDHFKVQRLTTDALLFSLLFVLIFVMIGIFTIKPLFSLLGASGQVLINIQKYMSIWYIGMPFVVVPMVGNNAIRATGDTKTPSLIMLVAVAINIVFDPLLIFGLGPFPKLGITGAALATVFGRLTTFTVASWVLIKREKMVTFQKTKLEKIFSSWKEILYIGLPVAGSRIVIPIAMGILTRLISKYGASAVAGFGVCTRIEFFALTIIRALSISFGPFMGQNIGAGNYYRVKRSSFISQRFSIFWGLGLFIIFLLWSKPIARIFNDDPKVIEVIMLYLSIVPISYGLQGIYLLSNTAFNVLKKPILAAGITILEMFVLYVPLAFLGSYLWEIKGIFYAIAFSYLVAGMLSIFTLRFYLKKVPEVGFENL